MATASRIAHVVVCDAGPLIHLDELDSLRLLCDFPAVLVPEVVWAEALRHRPHLFDLPNPSAARHTTPADTHWCAAARTRRCPPLANSILRWGNPCPPLPLATVSQAARPGWR